MKLFDNVKYSSKALLFINKYILNFYLSFLYIPIMGSYYLIIKCKEFICLMHKLRKYYCFLESAGQSSRCSNKS